MLIALSGKKQHGKNTVATIIQYLLYNKIYNNLSIDSITSSNLDKKTLSDTVGWQEKSFADKLKDIVCLLIGCTRQQLENPTFKEIPLGEQWWYYKSGSIITLYPDHKYDSFGDRYLVKPTPRMLMQLVGTECGRNIIHPQIWVNALFADYKYIGTKNIDGATVITANIRTDYPNWIITDLRFPNESKAVESRGGLIIRVIRESLTSSDTHESETALDDYPFDNLITNDGTIEQLVEKVKTILIKHKII